MEAKHTPGPWYADKIEDRAAYNIFPHGATYALLQVTGPVHDGAHPYGIAAEANARLIAAAPELLARLQDLLAEYGSLLSAYDEMRRAAGYDPEQEDSAATAARAAIAKATGSAS